MQAEDSKPELRVIDEEARETSAIPRLGEEGLESVLRLGPDTGSPRLPREEAMRLAADERKAFEARSVEPNVDEILTLPSLEESSAQLESRWGSAQRRGPVLWGYLAIIGLLLAAAAGWSVHTLITNKHLQEKVIAEAADRQAEEEQENAEARRLLETIEKQVIDYLSAPDPDQMLEHVRRRQIVAPMVKDWYARNPYRPVHTKEILSLHPATLDMRLFWLVQTKTDAGLRNLLVEQGDNNSALVDWETDVCYQPLPWDDFVIKKPEGLFDFRVTAVEDNFYSHEFQSPEAFLCLRLTARDSEEVLFGYVRRGTPEERQVREAFATSSGGPISMVLKLGHLPGSQARRSASVVSVVATRWCLVN